jgi:hypothetical protein
VGASAGTGALMHVYAGAGVGAAAFMHVCAGAGVRAGALQCAGSGTFWVCKCRYILGVDMQVQVHVHV